MREFDAWGLAMLLHHINDNRAIILQMCADGNHDERMDDKAADLFIEGILLAALHHAKNAALTSTHDRVWENGPFQMAYKIGMTYRQAEHELAVLRQCIEADLEKRKFAFIEPQKSELFEGLEAAWGPVCKIIPSASVDVKEAHIARMVELDTATVFYMMRVAEQGLRYLARKLRISLTHKGYRLPIEYADWDKVITGIKNKIDNVRHLPAGPKRQERLTKFSDAADHCLFMKDIWRNNISHTRDPYKPGEALRVIERVRDFMQFTVKSFS
jgi:hypothetical protein